MQKGSLLFQIKKKTQFIIISVLRRQHISPSNFLLFLLIFLQTVCLQKEALFWNEAATTTSDGAAFDLFRLYPLWLLLLQHEGSWDQAGATDWSVTGTARLPLQAIFNLTRVCTSLMFLTITLLWWKYLKDFESLWKFQQNFFLKKIACVGFLQGLQKMLKRLQK